MKAIELTSPRAFRPIESPEPAAPGPGEALLQVHRVGICGTDLSGFLGKMPFYSYPRIPGHELGVEVLAVGAGVTNVRPGDRCSVEPYMNCGQCYSCRRGHTNCCESNQTLGVMCDGGLCERIVLPARKLHVSAKLGYDELALVETLAIGCHAIDRAAPKPGDTVLVIGAGPIGLSVLEFAKVAGARVIVMDTVASRLDFVRSAMGGADTVLATGGPADVEAVSAVTAGRMAEVVVDATGSAASMARALEFSSFGGRLVYVGITQAEVTFPHAPVMHRRELTILASRNALARDFPRIVGLIEDGTIDTGPWITHRVPFADLPDAFAGLLEPNRGTIKAVVVMP